LQYHLTAFCEICSEVEDQDQLRANKAACCSAAGGHRGRLASRCWRALRSSVLPSVATSAEL